MKINLSRLGFGLSSIAGSGNFSHQQNLIKTAIDCGVTHFDTAPYYGSGDAEKILGDILSTCPDKVTITTKFGLFPVSGGMAGSLLRSTFRPIFRRVSPIKRIASSFVSQTSSQTKKNVFEKGELLFSLNESIRKLRRPVDIFLLHDADKAFAQNPQTIQELDEARKTGKTLLTGISGAEEIIQDIISRKPEIYSIAQLENSLTSEVSVSKLARSGADVITHRSIQGGLKQLMFLIEKRPGFKQVWLREIGFDPSDTDKLVQMLIELALYENPNGTVLFSSTQPDRIKKISAAVNSPILGEDGCLTLRKLFNEVYTEENN